MPRHAAWSRQVWFIVGGPSLREIGAAPVAPTPSVPGASFLVAPRRRRPGWTGTGASETDALDSLHALRPQRLAAPPRRRAVRRPGRRGWHHGHRRHPRRRLPGPAHRPRRAPRPGLRHLLEVLEARPRRPPVPPAAGVPAGLRGPLRAPAPAAHRPPP